MRRVEAIIRPHKLDEVSRALHHTPGVGGVTVTEVRGFGRGKLQEEQAHPATQAFDFEPHLKVELVCRAAAVEDIAAAIREAAPMRDVTGLFGPRFAAATVELEPGTWRGPIESGDGVHLVRIDERTEGRLPELDEVRDQVRREWENGRRVEAIETFYRDMLERYEIVIEWPGPATPERDS